MRLLTLSNRGVKPLKLRIAPFFDMALDESPNESAGRLDAEREGGALLFENKRNDFVRGVAFVTTSLENPKTETSRRHFFGALGRNISCPAFVEHGDSDRLRPTTAGASRRS